MSGILAIDTASDEIAVAFAGEGQAPRVLCRDGERNHSQLLLEMIDEVTGGDRAAINRIVVVRGPGSYAGLRVGIATAQGLSLGLGVPVAGVGTLQAAIAASGLSAGAALHPAGRGEYAVQEYVGSVPAGEITAAPATGLPGGRLAGEGAGAFGGTEVGPRERCLAALALARDQKTGPAEAMYLREPHITLARRARAATH